MDPFDALPTDVKLLYINQDIEEAAKQMLTIKTNTQKIKSKIEEVQQNPNTSYECWAILDELEAEIKQNEDMLEQLSETLLAKKEQLNEITAKLIGGRGLE